MYSKKMLGEILVSRGLVSRTKLDEALSRQKQARDDRLLPEQLPRDRLVSEARMAAAAQANSQLGSLLLEMGLVTQDQLDLALAEQDTSLEGISKLGSDKLAVVMEIGAIVNSTLNLAEVLRLIMNFSNQVTGSVASTLMLLDHETGELVFSIPTGPKSSTLEDIRIPPGEGIAGWVGVHEKPLLVSEVRHDPRFYAEIDAQSGFRTESILAVPLKAKNKLIGVLEVINKQGGGCFTEDDELFLSVFGAQAALAIENARLYQEMNSKMEEELRLQEKLSEADKLRALGLMASGIYHNFNNILTVILGNAELLAAGDEAPEPDRRLVAIQKAALDGADIVNRILAYSKASTAQEEGRTVDLNSLIQEVIGMTEPVWKGTALSDGIDLKVVACPAETETVVPGNESALKEVVVNALFNAIDAMPEGGRIEIKVRPMADEVALSVKDTGVGISPEAQKRIFDPFYSTKKTGHTGLGLSTVSGIIKNHLGRIEIDSAPGRGTTMTFILPSQATRKTDHEIKDSVGEVPALSILVVDDEVQIGTYMAEVLTQLGHEVDYFEEGQAALDALKERTYQLLLSDLVMPQMSGWEIIELAKATQSDIRVGLMTGWEVSDAELTDREVDFILRKPFKIKTLSEALVKAFTGDLS